MLEKNSWSYVPDGTFPDANSFGKCFKGALSESADKIFCIDDALLDSMDAGTNSGLDQYPLADISPTNGDLNVFGNEHESQECSYLSYDGWPDISYIEGFDGLFRSRDSPFGQEIVNNDDDTSWFSYSSHAIDSSGDALAPAFKSFCSGSSALRSTLKRHETDAYHVTHSTVPDSDEKGALSGYGVLHHSSYGSCLDANAECTSVPLSEKQALKVNGKIEDKMFPIIRTNIESLETHGTVRRNQTKNHKQFEAKRKDQSSEYSSGGPFHVPGTPQQFLKRTKRPDSSPNVIAQTSKEHVGKLDEKHCLQAIRSNKSQHEGMVDHAAFTDQVHILKQLHEAGVEGHCEVENMSTELHGLDTDSSVASMLSSEGSDKISVEETSFQHLQYMMEQLDFRTKLCLRDSLYRLARSAEQRNTMEHLGSGSLDYRDEQGVLTTKESNRCTGFMDVETNTNPIDRSIAHLLFHKPIGGSSLDSNVNVSFYTSDHEPNFMFQ